MDLHVQEYARPALVAKDAAAAAVLIFAVGAVVVFADILVHRWAVVEASVPAVVRTVVAGVPLLIVVSLILSIRRLMPAIAALGILGAGLLAYLAWFSRDEVFTLGALTFVVGAMLARYREPALVADDGGPTPPG